MFATESRDYRFLSRITTRIDLDHRELARYQSVNRGTHNTADTSNTNQKIKQSTVCAIQVCSANKVIKLHKVREILFNLTLR